RDREQLQGGGDQDRAAPGVRHTGPAVQRGQVGHEAGLADPAADADVRLDDVDPVVEQAEEIRTTLETLAARDGHAQGCVKAPVSRVALAAAEPVDGFLEPGEPELAESAGDAE